MNLRFVAVENDITCIFNGDELILVAYRTKKRNKWAFYQPIAWGLQWQSSIVITSTLEEYVTKLLREVR